MLLSELRYKTAKKTILKAGNTPMGSIKGTVNFGVIGSGWIAEAFIKAAKQVEGMWLSCVYSRTEERAKEFAQKAGSIFFDSDISYFTDIEEMAQSDSIDAVYIASPNALHFPQSMLFLKNKKHVICEKPISADKAHADLLFEEASRQDVIFMEAIMGLHMPQMQLLQEALPKIGRISQAHFTYCQLSSKYPALRKSEQSALSDELPNIFNPAMQTGAVMDIGIYCVYPIIALFGLPQSVIADALIYKNGIDLCGNALLHYPDKAVSLSYSKIADDRICSQIIGDEGTVTIKKLSHLDGIYLYDKEGRETLLHKNAADFLPMQCEAQSFYSYITNPKGTAEQYTSLSRLSTEVADILQCIRKKSGVCF